MWGLLSAICSTCLWETRNLLSSMPTGNWVLTHIEVFEALLHSSPVFDEPAARVLCTGSMRWIQQQR
jgi:hypothetical protein